MCWPFINHYHHAQVSTLHNKYSSALILPFLILTGSLFWRLLISHHFSIQCILYWIYIQVDKKRIAIFHQKAVKLKILPIDTLALVYWLWLKGNYINFDKAGWICLHCNGKIRWLWISLGRLRRLDAYCDTTWRLLRVILWFIICRFICLDYWAIKHSSLWEMMLLFNLLDRHKDILLLMLVIYWDRISIAWFQVCFE